MNPRSSRSQKYSASLFSIALLLSLLAGCSSEPSSQKSEPSQQAAMTVTAEPVQQLSLKQSLTLTGTVEAWQEMKVSADLTGLKVLSVAVDVGDEVKFGEELAYLDARDIRAQLAGAQARYRSSVANIEKMRNPNRPQQVAALRAGVEQAKAVVSQEETNLAQVKLNQASAQRTATRYSQALAEGYVTANEADLRVTDQNVQLMAIKAAEQRIQAAKFSLRQAQENLRLAQAGGRSEDVSIAQAQSDENLATIDRLKVQLEKTVVRAPDNGLVLTRSVQLGDMASVGQEFFTVARESRLQLWAKIPQNQIRQIKKGDSIRLEADGETETGEVEDIDPTIDPSDRQGRVKISLPPGTKLRVGAFARATLEGTENQVLAVKAESIQGQSDSEFVFVLQDKTARKLAVKTGRRQSDLVEVIQGLEHGQDVIVSGAPFLTDGDTVKLADS